MWGEVSRCKVSGTSGAGRVGETVDLLTPLWKGPLLRIPNYNRFKTPVRGGRKKKREKS